MHVPSELQFTVTHEWLKKEDAVFKCGITDYAQGELSDIVFVELPEVGRTIAKGDTLCVVESVKAASDIYAPLSGTVVSVNEALTAKPETINSSPFDDGWLCTIEPSNPSELEQTMDADQYKAQLEGK